MLRKRGEKIMKNLIISAEKAREILSDSGFPIGTDRVKNGVIQDVFRPPIGFATRCDKKDGKDHYEISIYSYDLKKFIREHGGQVEEI